MEKSTRLLVLTKLQFRIGEQMEIYNIPRGRGKTLRAIFLSEYLNIPIICHSVSAKGYILDTSKKFGGKIPEPITVAELDTTYKGHTAPDSGYIVDEAPAVLTALIAKATSSGLRNMEVMTLSDK